MSSLVVSIRHAKKLLKHIETMLRLCNGLACMYTLFQEKDIVLF